MSSFPCCNKIFCPGGGLSNLEFDSPLENFSSELPDQDLFIGLSFGWDNNVPPLGSNWTKDSCVGVCTSVVSQQDADDCAARENLICLNNDSWGTPPTIPTGGPSPPGNTPFVPPPTANPPTLFLNQLQSCQALCPDGQPFTFSVGPGVFIADSQDLANQMALSRACQLASANRICLSSITGLGCLQQFFSQTITVTGGIEPYLFDITGSLPPGLLASSSNPRNTIISGFPTSMGSTTFLVTVQDGNGNFMSRNYTISILGITNPDLPDGSTGAAYSEQFMASGGVAPFTFQVLNGSLPDGLTMDANGLVTGTPTLSDTFDFTVGVTSTDGNVCEVDCSINITGGCVDWTSMFWDDTSTFSGLGCTGTCSAVGRNVSASGQGADFVCSGGANLHGSTHYTGPACTAHIVITALALSANSSWGVKIVQDGITVGAAGGSVNNVGTPFGITTPQTVDVPIGPGLNSLIEVVGDDGSPILIIGFAGNSGIGIPVGSGSVTFKLT